MKREAASRAASASPPFGKWRGLGLCILVVAVAAVFTAVDGSGWRSSARFHTLIEVMATMLALVAGTIALARYYARPSHLHLFLGTGMIGTAAFDAAHALLTSGLMDRFLQSPAGSVSPWSWSASRAFLAVVMLLSWWTGLRETLTGGGERLRETRVYAVVGLLAACVFCLFALVPLPQAYHQGLPLGRPQELGIALVYALALGGFLRRRRWRADVVELGIVASLILHLGSEGLYMPRSFMLSDAMFDAAHLLKLAGYAALQAALLAETYQIFRQAESDRRVLAQLTARMRENDERLRLALASARIGTWEWHVQGDRLVWDDRTYELVGVPRGRAGLGFADFARTVHPEDRDRLSAVLAKAVAGDEDFESEHRSLRPDGTVLQLVARGRGFRDERGQFVRMMGVCLDITERKRAEQAVLEAKEAAESANQELRRLNAELARSNQELDDFAYIASHDLKEPLRGLHNYASFLLEDYADRLDEEGQDKLRALGRLAQRLETFIDSLLHFSRVGRVEMAVEPTDLAATITDVLETLEVTLRQREVSVELDELPVVRCDRVRVAELYRNLITNAIKYNDEDRVVVKLGFDPERQAFSVSDNGIGIREKHAEAVFKIFKRLHGRDKYGGGTGAGLTIARKIVERHGGRIWLESTFGEGTTFYFTLGAAAPAEPAARLQTA